MSSVPMVSTECLQGEKRGNAVLFIALFGFVGVVGPSLGWLGRFIKADAKGTGVELIQFRVKYSREVAGTEEC